MASDSDPSNVEEHGCLIHPCVSVYAAWYLGNLIRLSPQEIAQDAPQWCVAVGPEERWANGERLVAVSDIFTMRGLSNAVTEDHHIRKWLTGSLVLSDVDPLLCFKKKV